MDGSLATPEEVAAYLNGIPVKTLAKWRSEGTGPAYMKVGRHVRYRLADVVAWENSRLVRARP
jgi:excisionase family DNA binding protein